MSRNDIAGCTVHSTRSSASRCAHGAFEHQRRAGHGVEHLAVLCRRGDETFGDLGVHVGERVGRFVDVVERVGVAGTVDADG